MKKKYITPIITKIVLDNQISLILCSDYDGWKNHKPGCPCRHCSGYNNFIEENNSNNPYN